MNLATNPDSLRAILLMVFSMFAFAMADSFIKLNGESLPPSQVLTTLGLGGTIVFGLISRARGIPLYSRHLTHPAILTRTVSEIIATCGFLFALTLLDFSVASSILQVTPLLVTLGAAVCLKETISWHRWSAIIVGFCGVIIILNPTGGAANLLQANPGGTALALVGVVGLAGHDLSTRFIPKDVPNLQAATWGFCAVILAGLILRIFGEPWVLPGITSSLLLLCLIFFASAGYFAITAAMRIGEISIVAPYRYTRIIFAFIISVVFFGETLTAHTFIGATIVVASGLYVWLREKMHARPLQHRPASR